MMDDPERQMALAKVAHLEREIDRLLEIKKTLSLQAAGLLTENERLRLEIDNAKAAIEQARDALSGWNEEGDDG